MKPLLIQGRLGTVQTLRAKPHTSVGAPSSASCRAWHPRERLSTPSSSGRVSLPTACARGARHPNARVWGVGTEEERGGGRRTT